LLGESKQEGGVPRKNDQKNLSKDHQMDCYVLISTVSTVQEGQRISKFLVEGRLAACINMISRVKSIYLWKGKICEEKEVLLVIKTARGKIDDIINKIKALHRYEMPEILAFKVEKGEKCYLNWVKETVQLKIKNNIDNKKVKG
jgi:periplasmic divalent cation tolerance protein